ncbi:MAG: TatD family hydrolase [candidate division Zixibacteria bacterium]|nr:TatD family hydrolase [candidate division Zixibacteria bacterium]
MIDTHCHLEYPQYKKTPRELVAEAADAGVSTIVTIGTDLESSRTALDIARDNESVYATVGVHPHDAKSYTQKIENAFLEAVNDPNVVAIGEIGLDYYRDLSPRDIQKKAFHAQLELASRTDKPVVIHVRESFADAFSILCEHSDSLSGAVLHCFSEGIEEARKVLDRGWIISVGGVVTYKNSKMADVAAWTPLESMILETDAPYLTPVPHRGKTNRPAYVSYVYDFVANLRGIPRGDLEKKIDMTAKKFYGLVETFG